MSGTGYVISDELTSAAQGIAYQEITFTFPVPGSDAEWDAVREQLVEAALEREEP